MEEILMSDWSIDAFIDDDGHLNVLINNACPEIQETDMDLFSRVNEGIHLCFTTPDIEAREKTEQG
jgi:hypothetical protein